MPHIHDSEAAPSTDLAADPLVDLGLCLRRERVLDTRLARRLAQAGIDLWDLPRSLTDRALALTLTTPRFGIV
jgi:hypothetical protein